MGLPFIPDMFSTGESAHGCGHVVRTSYQGTRTLAADYITDSTKKTGISIRTKTYIDRISLELDSTGAMRANGVFLQDTIGQKTYVKARKEVIISAGTYGSPAILLRSGIGSKQEVEKLGIKSQVDLPGVGKHLMDHLVSLPFPCILEPKHVALEIHSCMLLFFDMIITLCLMKRRYCFHSTRSQSLPSQTTISFGTAVRKTNHWRSTKPIKADFSPSFPLEPLHLLVWMID
jgi:choline dehydrogenase-like flavoprotein